MKNDGCIFLLRSFAPARLSATFRFGSIEIVDSLPNSLFRRTGIIHLFDKLRDLRVGQRLLLLAVERTQGNVFRFHGDGSSEDRARDNAETPL